VIIINKIIEYMRVAEGTDAPAPVLVRQQDNLSQQSNDIITPDEVNIQLPHHKVVLTFSNNSQKI
jgi:hypothetical protein